MPDIDPNALIILVIMIIGGLKWFLENLKSRKEEDDLESDSEAGNTFADLYEEARRQIQERLNPPSPGRERAERAPSDEYLDPQVFRPVAAAPPPVPGAVPAPPPLPAAPAPFQQKSFRRPQLSAAEKAALKRVQEQARKGAQPGVRQRRPARSHVRQLLSSPTAARDAIILREILSTPRGRM